MSIEEQIRRYIYKQVDKLRTKGDSVNLQCVYPDILEYVLGNSKDVVAKFNECDCDYWMTIGKYKINGSMIFGTAVVTLTEDR